MVKYGFIESHISIVNVKQIIVDIGVAHTVFPRIAPEMGQIITILRLLHIQTSWHPSIL